MYKLGTYAAICSWNQNKLSGIICDSQQTATWKCHTCVMDWAACSIKNYDRTQVQLLLSFLLVTAKYDVVGWILCVINPGSDRIVLKIDKHYVSEGKITCKLPSSLASLELNTHAKLTRLLPEDNRFTETIHPSLTSSPKLKQFCVLNNELSEPIPSAIGKMQPWEAWIWA